MRNANPRDREMGRSWGFWFRHYSERKKHEARTQKAGFIRINPNGIGGWKP